MRDWDVSPQCGDRQPKVSWYVSELLDQLLINERIKSTNQLGDHPEQQS